jgi:hypothetical protein
MSARAALVQGSLTTDVAELVLWHRAAKVIQSFFRRSQYFVMIENDCDVKWYPQPRVTVRNPLRKEQRRSDVTCVTVNYTRTHFTRHFHRSKPLSLVLEGMMRSVVTEKAEYVKRSKKKRKRPYFFRITLKKASRYGPAEFDRTGLPIVVVTQDTVM